MHEFWIFNDQSILRASTAYAIMDGLQQFNNDSALHASTANAVRGGEQMFCDSSALNASVENALSGGKQVFYDSSTLNASKAYAISGGKQIFRESSTLHASAENTISGAEQHFYDSSTLNASIPYAISGGKQVFFDTSTLNASKAYAINGGTQEFYDASTLDTSAAYAINGGTLEFYNRSTLKASKAYAVSGGVQRFTNNSTLTASETNAVNGGTQVFYDTSTLNASAANTISGGTQVFYNTSTLNASATHAVSGGTQVFTNTSTLSVRADNALSNATSVSFDNSRGGTGGILTLNGYSTAIGRMVSLPPGSGRIVNRGDINAVLTVDGTLLGDSFFSGVIANGRGHGTLGLNKEGQSTLTLAGVNTYTGNTMVSGGTLRVDGSIASSLMTTIASGATLSGSGTLGNTHIASGATLAPGDAALWVNGDLTIDPGATYRVYADPSSAQSTRVNVTGTAFLEGGTVIHEGFDGEYRPGVLYTILTASDDVTGHFDGAQSNYAYLIPILTHNPHTVTMELVRKKDLANSERTTSFAAAVNTNNQQVTAWAVESLGPDNDLYQLAETLTSDLPPDFFNKLSGKSHASAKTIMRGSASGARALPFKHLRTNLASLSRPGVSTAQAGTSYTPALTSSLPQNGALPAWAELVGNWQTLTGEDAAASATQRTGGMFVGADHPVGNGWRVGGALGYTDSTLRMNDRNSSNRIDSYSATLYSGKAFEAGVGKLNVLIGAAYSWHTIDNQRRINVAGLNQSLKADYRASTGQLFTELGYAVPMGNATVEPFAGVAWSDLRTRGFSESGGSAALSGRSQSDAQTTTTLGLRAQTPFAVGKAGGTVRGSVGWRHALNNRTPQYTLAFNGSQPFTVTGTPMPRDVALLELGADTALARNATLGLSYEGQLGNGSLDHSGSVNMRWWF